MSIKRCEGNPERLRVLPAAILDAMHEPAALLDAGFRILKAGGSFCRYWGRSPDETDGQMLHELGMGQVAASTLKEALARLFESPSGPDLETAEVRYDLPDPHQASIRARRIDPQGDSPPLILLTLAGLADGGGTAIVRDDDEKRFRIMTDAAFEGIALTRGGVFVDLNDQLAHMLGYRRDELIGLPVANCVAAEDRARVAEFMAAGRLEPYEHLAMRKDGTVFHVEIRVRTSLIDNRETRIAAIRDITERKQAERELQLARFCLDHAAVGIFRIDEDARILSVNDQVCRYLGYSRDELLGLRVFDIDHSFSKGRWKAHRQKLAIQGHAVFETVHSRKDGSTVPVEVTVNRHEFEGEIFSISFVKDIAERKQAEEALKLTQFTIDRASFGCSWIRRDGRFFYVNDHICRSLGYSRQELLQLSVVDIDPDFDLQVWDDYWSALIRDNVRTFETTHQRKDGTTFPVEITANYVAFGGKEYSCAFSTDISERKRARETLLRFQFSIDRSSDAIFWMGRDGDFLYVNDQACRSLGYSREELMGIRLWDIDPNFPKDRWKIQWQEMSVDGNRIFETIHRRKDGTEFPVEVSSNHILFSDGEHHHVAFVRDISSRKQAEAEQSKLESQLYQAQKMESIGRLAGGVAHDFNNMLGVILGYADLMKRDLAADHPLLKKVMEIEKAAIHSRDITTQLLAFSRKQVVSPQALDLNRRIGDLQKTLARLIGEDIDLQVFTKEGLWTVKFDPTQIEQILINLAVNARDAMPAGGKLTIETANTHLDEAYCREHVGFIPGDFVRLSVSDNGSGMEPETLSHVFEPFFTTKAVGKGTGLGLATVYGIVKQGGGFINAYSEIGQGTTFTLYLPRMADKKVPAIKSEVVPVVDGTETVLLVEDDEMVRRMTRAMLERIGYTVQAVSTPEAALALFESTGSAVDLLMTDVVMPKMNGKELRDRLAAIRPDIKTLFMSGYTANVIVQHGVLDEGVHFIQKPFGMDDLAREVRKALA